MACVLAVLLWGAETCVPMEPEINKMNVFHHRSICWILKIKMSQVQEERMTNESIRSKFGKIKPINVIIREPQLNFIGHVVQKSGIANTVLSAWTEGRRPCGCPIYTTRSTYLKYLKEILPNHTKDDGELSSWIMFTKGKKRLEETNNQKNLTRRISLSPGKQVTLI